MEYIPYGYQTIAINRIVKNRENLLMLRHGMGKKVIIFSALKKIKEKNNINRMLLLVSKQSDAILWQKEIKKWNHLDRLILSVVYGSASEKKKLMEKDADIYVTNRENVSWIIDNDYWNFDAVIICDINFFCNINSTRYKGLIEKIGDVKKIVGTIEKTHNLMKNMWDLMYLMDFGKRLGRSKAGFFDKYFFTYIDKRGRILHRESKNEAKSKIRFLLRDVIVDDETIGMNFLPKVIYTKTELTMSETEKSKYEWLKTEGLSNAELTQLANGNICVEGNNYVLHNKKIQALKKILSCCEEQIMIVYWFKSDCNRIKECFCQAKIIETPDDIDAWNMGKYGIGLIHPAVGGIKAGYQLKGTRIVWYSLTWNSQMYSLINNRFINDFGNECIIIDNLVMAGSIDEQTYTKMQLCNCI